MPTGHFVPGARPSGRAQTMAALIGAGFNGGKLTTMLGITGAESGFDVHARHVNADGSIDRGPYQINNKAHPEVSDACAYSYVCGAQAAWRISKHGTDFTPWSTFNNGTYKAHEDTAANAANAAVHDVTSPITDPINSVVGAIGTLTSQRFWFELGKLIGGFFLMLMGAYLVVRRTEAYKSAKKIAGAAAV